MIALPDTGAIFSPCRTRRWWLGRLNLFEGGAHDSRRILFIGVQPSNADEKDNDPTILREIGFATRWGYSFLDKVNLFDRHSPNPDTLYTDAQPVSAENDAYVFAAAARADLIMCVWGSHGAHQARGARMARLLRERGLGPKLHVFGFTKQGYPIHTLARGKSRIPDSAMPMAWT